MPFALSDMLVHSDSFRPEESIPRKHTGEGEESSPPLRWEGAPDHARSFAVICHDPDAPLVSPAGTYGFVHWVLYGIPASVTSLEEGAKGFSSGKNDMGRLGYAGPMPPKGHGQHRYYFWVLALDDELNVEPGMTMWQLLKRIEPHVMGMNRLVGVYRRD